MRISDYITLAYMYCIISYIIETPPEEYNKYKVNKLEMQSKCKDYYNACVDRFGNHWDKICKIDTNSRYKGKCTNTQ